VIKNSKVPAGSVTTNGFNGNFYYISYNLSGIRIFTTPRPVPRRRHFRATINTQFVYMYNTNYINMIYMRNRRRRFFWFIFFLRELLSLRSRCLCFTLSPLTFILLVCYFITEFRMLCSDSLCILSIVV